MTTALSNNIKPDISKLVETEGDFQLTIQGLGNILSVNVLREGILSNSARKRAIFTFLLFGYN